MTKKKPSKTRGTPAQFVPGLMRDPKASHKNPVKERVWYIDLESRAIAALDGETQYCIACDSDICAPREHKCGKRYMTAEERAVVEAARLFVVRHTDGAHCSFELDPHNCGSSEQLINACRALRAARGK